MATLWGGKVKTAEEWIKYLDPNTSGESCCYSPVSAEDIKQIQLDAMKDGMQRAAKVARDNYDEHDPWTAQRAILIAAEQLTIENL